MLNNTPHDQYKRASYATSKVVADRHAHVLSCSFRRMKPEVSSSQRAAFPGKTSCHGKALSVHCYTNLAGDFMLNRQKIVLHMLKLTGRPVCRTELTKWCFLLKHEFQSFDCASFYDFVPYRFGPYSF